MNGKRLSKLELQIMQILWRLGAIPIREVQEAFPAAQRPAYTTVQTTIYRLEEKGAVRRVKKIGNAHIFEAVLERNSTQKGLLDELVNAFGGRIQPIISYLIETRQLTLEDVRQAEQRIVELDRKEKSK